MPKFSVSVPHSLDRDEAIQRLRGFSDQMRSNVPIELTEVNETWDESGNLVFSFQALGLKIAGEMVTSHIEVTVMGDLPFAALVFRGAIENQIAEKIREAIA